MTEATKTLVIDSDNYEWETTSSGQLEIGLAKRIGIRPLNKQAERRLESAFKARVVIGNDSGWLASRPLPTEPDWPYILIVTLPEDTLFQIDRAAKAAPI